jgi:hypothetical protein
MMGVSVLRVEALPDNPLDAAGIFHADYLPKVRGNPDRAEQIVVCFPPAGHEHRGWRLAAIQELARELAPVRANAVAGSDPVAIAQAMHFLAQAPGITGQILAVDGNSGGNG